ncbi:MAG: hypothetical protein WBC31_01785 [Candidatus Phosphoribacter baldrii]|jgi:hypothetical protein|nr:hypothetical protein [Candidatus Phosphoribacter baldrii]MBK6955853.1 hypothetical protein [Candidatus Phosphoribacter baldrii]
MGGPVPNSAVGPGIGAFLAFFALAVALYFLMRNMNARMRRMAYRERDRLAALEAAEAAKAEGGGGAGGSAPGARPSGAGPSAVVPQDGPDPAP